MASVHSPIRSFLKPLLFKILGKKGYLYAQFYGKMRDIKYRLVEEVEMELLPSLVEKGDFVIDIGANYAYYTDRLSHYVGENGKVLSFEPIPFTHSVCKMIVKALKLKNVELHRLGVSDKNEELTFKIPKLAFGSISAGQAHISNRVNGLNNKEKYYNFDEEEEVSCTVVALDNFEFEIGDRRLSFIKIDIEGAEFFALKGMRNLIEQYNPVILIEVQPYFLHGFGIEETQMKAFITEKLGYKIYHYNIETKKLNLLEGTFFDANFILIPNTKTDFFNQLIE